MTLGFYDTFFLLHMLHWAFISQLKKNTFYNLFLLNNIFFCLFVFPQCISKWLLLWEDKTKTFFRSNIVFAFYLLCHKIFQNHKTVTITFYNNSFVTYQNYTFSGIWFNQKFLLVTHVTHMSPQYLYNLFYINLFKKCIKIRLTVI